MGLAAYAQAHPSGRPGSSRCLVCRIFQQRPDLRAEALENRRQLRPHPLQTVAGYLSEQTGTKVALHQLRDHLAAHEMEETA